MLIFIQSMIRALPSHHITTPELLAIRWMLVSNVLYSGHYHIYRPQLCRLLSYGTCDSRAFHFTFWIDDL